MAQNTRIVNPGTPFPATITNGGTYDSGLMSANGASNLTAGVLMTQNGSIIVDRYIDNQGSLLLDQTKAAVTANTVAFVTVSDNKPFLSMREQLINSGTVACTITAAQLLSS